MQLYWKISYSDDIFARFTDFFTRVLLSVGQLLAKSIGRQFKWTEGRSDGAGLSWPVNLNSIQGDVQQTQQQQSKQQQQHCCKSREKNISWSEHLQEDNFLLLVTFSSLCPRSSANYCIHENSLVRGCNSSSPPCSPLSLLYLHTAPVFIHVNKCSIEDQCSSK